MLVLSPSASCSGAFYSLCCRGSSWRWEGDCLEPPGGLGSRVLPEPVSLERTPLPFHAPLPASPCHVSPMASASLPGSRAICELGSFTHTLPLSSLVRVLNKPRSRTDP